MPKITRDFDKKKYIQDTFGEMELYNFLMFDKKYNKKYTEYIYQRLFIAKNPKKICSPSEWCFNYKYPKYSYKQIATKLNISIKLVKQIEREALKKIKVLLEQRNINKDIIIEEKGE